MTEPKSGLLSPTQRQIAAFALTLLALVGSAAMLIATSIATGRLVGFYSGVLWPLAVAGVLALIVRPLVEIIERRFKFSRLWAVILLFTLLILFVAGLLVLGITNLVDQVTNLIAYLPQFGQSVSTYFHEHYPTWSAAAQRELEIPFVHNAVDSLSSQLNNLASHTLPTLVSAGGGVVDIFQFLTHVAVIPIYLFFLLLFRGEPTANLHRHLTFFRPPVRDNIVFLVREFIGIIESFFRGQLVIGMIMGALLALGFTIVGLKFGLVIGLCLGVLNIIPYLGTIVGLLITIPLALFQPDGGAGLVWRVLLVKLIVQAIEGWFLTPRIMGHQTGLHPAAIIFAVFFWGETFHGILGMLLAIPLTAFIVTIWRLVRRKYLAPASGARSAAA